MPVNDVEFTSPGLSVPLSIYSINWDSVTQTSEGTSIEIIATESFPIASEQLEFSVT